MSETNERKGLWLHRASGEIFIALRIVPVIDPEFGHTHVLTNESHTWSGPKERFEKEFNKL